MAEQGDKKSPTKSPERPRQKSRLELLTEKQAQLPKFQRKLYGPTSLSGVQTLANSPNELANFLNTQVPEDMVFQAEVFHKHSFLGEQKVILMIRVDTDEFQSRGTQVPVMIATKKRKSNKLNIHFDLPDGSLLAKLREKEKGQYIMYDNGANPENKKKSHGREIRKQIGGCRITNLGALEPIKMRGLFPEKDDGSRIAAGDVDYLFHLEQNIDVTGAFFVETTTASRAKATGRHTLHFNYSGNIERIASTHNFIMQTRKEQTRAMQMGKFAKRQYILDVNYPLTPLEGLFIALCHFHG